MKVCDSCGNLIPSNATFCPECGQKVIKEKATQIVELESRPEVVIVKDPVASNQNLLKAAKIFITLGTVLSMCCLIGGYIINILYAAGISEIQEFFNPFFDEIIGYQDEKTTRLLHGILSIWVFCCISIWFITAFVLGVKTVRKIDRALKSKTYQISLTVKISNLIFVSRIGGILLLCVKKQVTNLPISANKTENPAESTNNSNKN